MRPSGRGWGDPECGAVNCRRGVSIVSRLRHYAPAPAQATRPRRLSPKVMRKSREEFQFPPIREEDDDSVLASMKTGAINRLTSWRRGVDDASFVSSARLRSRSPSVGYGLAEWSWASRSGCCAMESGVSILLSPGRHVVFVDLVTRTCHRHSLMRCVPRETRNHGCLKLPT